MEYREEFIGANNITELEPDDYIPVRIQGLKFKLDETVEVVIGNFHGLWIPGFGKGDCEDRLNQSEKVLEFMGKFNSEFEIFGGDFNLSIDTESVAALTFYGFYGNIIIESGIETTRTDLYSKRDQFPHAGYIFVGEGVAYSDLLVNKEFEGSDHAPMSVTVSF